MEEIEKPSEKPTIFRWWAIVALLLLSSSALSGGAFRTFISASILVGPAFLLHRYSRLVPDRFQWFHSIREFLLLAILAASYFFSLYVARSSGTQIPGHYFETSAAYENEIFVLVFEESDSFKNSRLPARIKCVPYGLGLFLFKEGGNREYTIEAIKFPDRGWQNVECYVEDIHDFNYAWESSDRTWRILLTQIPVE